MTIGHFATPEAAALNVARAMADEPPSTKRKAKSHSTSHITVPPTPKLLKCKDKDTTFKPGQQFNAV